MKNIERSRKKWARSARLSDEKGSTMVLALFVLALVSVFVAYALTRSSAEAASIGNESSEARTLYAAQGSLEMMTRNFNKVFEVKLNPAGKDITRIESAVVPGLSADYDFQQDVEQTSKSTTKYLTDGAYAGLYAIRDDWMLKTTATSRSDGTQIELTRNILNNRIPIFQFGIFYDDDLELFRPPRFSFGGRVHSNRHFFVSPGSEGVYFDSRVTAAGFIITQSWRNWFTGDSGNDDTFIKDASGVFRRLRPNQGSVLNGSPNIFGSGKWLDLDLPPSHRNPNWAANSAVFDGNLQAETKELKLPLKVGNSNADLIEMIKRGREEASSAGGDLWRDDTGNVVPVTAADSDTPIQRSERFANKTGIRVSLADSKAKLPGCASGVGNTGAVSGPCGVRLDGHWRGDGTDRTALPSPLPTSTPTAFPNALADAVRGYQPKSMKLSTSDAGFGYTATRLNGERLYTGNEVWIKIETVATDSTTQAIITKDITEDILALGVTEEAPTSFGVTSPYSGSYSGSVANNGSPSAPSSNLLQTTAQSASTYPDSRSIIKLQRWTIPGPAIPGDPSGQNTLYSYSGTNVVRRFTNGSVSKIQAGCPTASPAPTTLRCQARNGAPVDPVVGSTQNREDYGHLKLATVNGTANVAIVPFPIEIFDTREGEHYDERSSSHYANLNRLTRNGIMSMIDIDVANLRRFLRGDFNGLFPSGTAATTGTPFSEAKGSGLTDADIPQSEGWVIYVSDRRGDADFDGEFDMEDIYGSGFGNDGTMQTGEDLQKSGFGFGVLNTSYGTETERYNTNTISPDVAAVMDHKYYRRGVRLVNGTVLPGIYDSVTPSNTRGVTFASENGVYVLGNFNATHVTSVPSTGNTPYDDYRPFNTPTHIPASIVADAVIVLSNNWNDAQTFSSPYYEGARLASDTTIRFAMIAGDTIASREETPNQGGISPRLNGGVHNFKRFLERWTGERLNYSGSLINLYNSRNNNGSFKCCNTVYDPPYRNWVFDSTFLDPTRIPPGTPFFQYAQTTGFERATD
ncbi:MAG: hypothetical protein AB7F88_03010 [Pyrinomonadaceae bacterium]